MRILLVGTGPMAIEYFKVLKSKDLDFEVVGRNELLAQIFEEKTGYRPKIGGVENYILDQGVNGFTHAIIATGPEKLLEVTLFLLENGISKILVEKPAALSIEELISNEDKLIRFRDKVFVAYNRRFYKSFHYAQEMIQEDGGLESMTFEFTELVDRVPLRPRPVKVLNNWFFANSTHVIDMAFAFAGLPKNFRAIVKSGNLEWHKNTLFAGSGITEKGVVFSYLSNWESAGRWGIELMTSKRRIILRPLEKIQIQKRNSFNIEEPEVDYDIDLKFKPGLFLQVESFMTNHKGLCTIEEHIYQSENVFSKVLNGT